MPMPLDQWNDRLDGHFRSLVRKRAGSGFPIFSLEHDLDSDEIREIFGFLRSRLKARLPLSTYWLLWVIYATECGYDYVGDEYWKSFEERTPGWQFSDRYKVVPWFRKFQSSYNGVVPSGPWAAHFKIIAWPITHAILPRYLQRQFARVLYDLRFRLANLSTLEPATIGRLLSANAHHASSRFREFLQQEELVGRIVLGLLGEAPAEGREPIYPPTLRRIVADLEKVRSARDWLKETQRIVTDRFKGIGHGTGPPVPRPRDGREAPDVEHIDIRPGLLLRYAGSATWSVVMEVPPFREVAGLNVEIHSFLRRTRCRLNGASDFKPAGWLLSGKRKGVLKSWPDPLKPLIQFEQPHGTVDHLLETDCRLSAGPIWLFRIASDGTAREITGHIVRPGYNYIVVTSGEFPEPRACMSPCDLDCAGVNSFRLDVPLHVSAELTAWLKHLGLQVARTIRVWPAGLPARGWDGEGKSEWLTTETPCFGIVHDHPVDAYVLSLNDRHQATIEAGEVGHPVFARIAALPAGMHTLTVKARRSPSLEAVAPSPPAEGFVQLNVRAPEPWAPGVASHPGLIVTLDPHDADLDTFWRNDVSLSVLGPEGYSVIFGVSLQGRDGQEILSEHLDGPISLPVTPDAWRRKFAQFLAREEYTWRYLEAASGRLAINGEILGECNLHFEHEVPPLRWVLHHDHGNIILRLIDDTGEEEGTPKIFFFSMERPLRARRASPEKALHGIAVEAPGALFYAKHGAHSDRVIVSTGLSAEGFQGLSANPEFPDLEDGSIMPSASLSLLSGWQGARLSGFLANVRRQQVVDGLLKAIFGILCGADWARAEAAFLQNPYSEHARDRLQRAVDTNTGFAAVLRRDFAKMDDDPSGGSRWYTELAATYSICQPQDVRPKPIAGTNKYLRRNLCTFALTLASQPYRVRRMYGEDLAHLLEEISKKPAVLRGARLLALLSANQNCGQPARMLPGWKW